MRYRLQTLTLFAILVIVLLGARGLAKKAEIPQTATILDVKSGILSASEESLSTATVPDSGNGTNGTLSETSPLSAKPIFYRTANDSAPTVSAEEVLVADVQSGEKYLEIADNKRWPMASLSKLMTAVVADEKLNPENKITLTPGDLADGENDPLSSGDVYKTKDLFKTMLVASRNTAANALARSFDYQKFLIAMNVKARDLGMGDTNYSDPSGLSVANQSTASDLLKLVRGISAEHPDIWKTTESGKVVIKEQNSGKTQTFLSTHQFVNRKDFYGGKTGYTPEADGNLLTLFLYGKRTIVIIVMGSSDRFGDSQAILDWFEKNYAAS